MIRRNGLVIGLFFLAPLVAEFLLGNLPIIALPAVLALAPLYGGGALLIRELVRRRGLGWPNIVILGVAYGVLEEGLTTQSLFNPNYAGQHLLADGFIPALGIAVPWTLYVVGIHIFWSICAPILMMEAVARERRTTPWLGRRGLIITGVVFAAGIAITTVINMKAWPYTATAGQFTATGIIIVLLAAAGLLIRFRRTERAGSAPKAWVVFVATLVAAGIFQALTLANLSTWAGVALIVADVIVFLALLVYWATGRGWSDLHYLAIGAALLITYAWHAFTESPVGSVLGIVDLVGNAIFAIAALTFIRYAYKRVTRPRIETAPQVQ